VNGIRYGFFSRNGSGGIVEVIGKDNHYHGDVFIRKFIEKKGRRFVVIGIDKAITSPTVIGIPNTIEKLRSGISWEKDCFVFESDSNLKKIKRIKVRTYCCPEPLETIHIPYSSSRTCV
jgi:hypothetical protein